jgi:hypothetical protein
VVDNVSLRNKLAAITSLAKGKSFLRQSGATILPLALAGLLGSSVVAVPLLNRALTSLDATQKSSSVQSISAEAAAWYAMWRLEHDPTVHAEFSGSPPTTTFMFRGAEITIVGVEPPDNSGIILSMSATPNMALPETPTVVTYTMILKNDDDVAHDILRVVADPASSFEPVYVAGTTTGLTTVDPVTTGNKHIWTPVNPVTLAPFGAETTLTWQMTVDEVEGNYWMDGSVRIDGVGDIGGLTEANVLVTAENDLVVTSVVTPVQVEAGVHEQFDYTITIENSGVSSQTLETVKFWATKDLEVVAGSISGFTSGEPTRNSDFKNNDRWEWTWSGLSVLIEPGVPLVMYGTAEGSLSPGTWFSETAIITTESTANGQEVAATTSASSPIKAVRVYDISVDFLGTNLSIEALLDNTGVEALTWVESHS